MFRNTGYLEVGVFAGDLTTTTAARIPARKSIRCADGVPAPPEESVYDAIMNAVNNVEATQNELAQAQDELAAAQREGAVFVIKANADMTVDQSFFTVMKAINEGKTCLLRLSDGEIYTYEGMELPMSGSGAALPTFIRPASADDDSSLLALRRMQLTAEGQLSFQAQLFNAQGPSGKSAYELYLEAGGTLSESAWLASLGVPEFAESLADCTDPHKLYVLPDGYLWAYQEPGDDATGTGGWYNTGLLYGSQNYEPRIAALESDQVTQESRIAALEGGAVESVPAYWQTAIDALSDTMAERQANGPECFQFVWFSDLHGKQINKTDSIGAVAKRLCEQYGIPFVAISGDIVSQASWPEVASVYQEFKDVRSIFSAIDDHRLLATIGNHDGAWGAQNADGLYYRKSIGNLALYNQVFRHQAADSARVFGPDGTYFYVDASIPKIRFVMLNTHTDGDGSSDADGEAVYNSMSNSVLGTQQLAWLQDTALNVPEGWGVALMGHYPITQIRDAALFAGIINAYNGKTNYEGGSVNLQRDTWGDGVSSACNTSAAGAKDYAGTKGEIIAYFHGHIHQDAIDAETLTCPCISITTAGGDVRDENAPERVSGTATETALDVVTIDRKARMIHMTRLGAGEDRSVAYTAPAPSPSYTNRFVKENATLNVRFGSDGAFRDLDGSVSITFGPLPDITLIDPYVMRIKGATLTNNGKLYAGDVLTGASQIVVYDEDSNGELTIRVMNSELPERNEYVKLGYYNSTVSDDSTNEKYDRAIEAIRTTGFGLSVCVNTDGTPVTEEQLDDIIITFNEPIYS